MNVAAFFEKQCDKLGGKNVKELSSEINVLGIYLCEEYIQASKAVIRQSQSGKWECSSDTLKFSENSTKLSLPKYHKDILVPPSLMNMKCDEELTCRAALLKRIEEGLAALSAYPGNNLSFDKPTLLCFSFPERKSWTKQKEDTLALLTDSVKNIPGVHVALSDFSESVFHNHSNSKNTDIGTIVNVDRTWTEIIHRNKNGSSMKYEVAYGSRLYYESDRKIDARINDYENGLTWKWQQVQYADWAEGFEEICKRTNHNPGEKDRPVWVVCDRKIFEDVAKILVHAEITDSKEKIIYIEDPASAIAGYSGMQLANIVENKFKNKTQDKPVKKSIYDL